MRLYTLVGLNAFAHAINIVLALAFAIMGARLLPADDFGELRTAMTLLPLLMAFSLPGYDSAILRHSHMDKTVRLLRIFIWRSGFALLGSFLLLAAIAIFHTSLSASLLFFLLVIALLLPFFETSTGWRNYLIGRRLRRVAVKLLLRMRLISLAMLASLFGLIYLLDANRLLLLPAYMIALIVPALLTFMPVALRQLRRRMEDAGQWFDAAEKHNLVTALGATIAGLLFTLAFSLDKLWLRHELGAVALASYAILVMVPQEFARLFDAMIPLFYRVLFFGRNPVGVQKIVWSALLLCVCALVYIGFFYAFSSDVFGASYRYDMISVGLSGLMLVGLSLEFFCSHRFFADRGARGLLSYTLANLLLSLPAIYFGLALGGVQGMMVGLFIKQLGVAVGSLWFMPRLR